MILSVSKIFLSQLWCICKLQVNSSLFDVSHIETVSQEHWSETDIEVDEIHLSLRVHGIHKFSKDICQSELFHLQLRYPVHCLVISHYSSIIKFSGSHCWRVSLGHNSGVTIHLCFSLARYFGEASGSDHQFLESTSALRFLDSYYRVLTHKIQDCNKCSMSPLMSTKLSIIQVTSHASLARFENSKIMHFSRTVENFYKRPRWLKHICQTK